jgi:hypothetical protein
MKKMLIFIILLMIYQEDGGGSTTNYRRYQQVMIPPYHPTESIQATFQFANTYADDITLTWRISNRKYNRALIYTQLFSPRNLIQRSIMLPSHLFDGLVSTLHLQATRFRFESSVDLQVFPQASYQINQFGSTFMSANTISRIDSLGFINYEREHLQFEGMSSQQLHAIYGRFDLSVIRIRFLSPIAKEIKFQDARLLIADHPDLEGLPLFQSTYRQLILQPIFSGHAIELRMPPLYVHPKTLFPSNVPVTNYVATNYLFFPLKAFLDLRHHPMKLQLQFNHFHTFTLDYEFHYVANKAVFGSCLQSHTCIKIYG